MGYCDYNCSALPDHIITQCNQWKRGGICALGVLECDANIADYESLADLLAAVAAGKLKWISKIKGAYASASPIMIDNPLACGSDQVLDGFTHKLTFKDANVEEDNDTFFAALNGRNTWLLWYECSTNKLVLISDTASWIVTPAEVPEKNTEIQKYNGEINWISDKNTPLVHFTAPAGLNVC